MGLDKINVIRKQKGLSVDDLCELSGVPKSTLSKITAGITRNPSLDTITAIANALGCTIDDFRDDSISQDASYSWGIPILAAYQKADESTQRAACAVLRIGHIKAPLYDAGDIETLAAHSDGIPSNEVQGEVEKVLKKLERKK